jgi:hypothetical protein
MGIMDFVGETLGKVVDAGYSLVDTVSENPLKSVAVVAVAVGTGGIALVYAPAIAATLGGAGLLGTTATGGTVIATLEGVALSNASLAALGGGALSVGGAGMAGGTAVVAGAGAAAGAGVSGTVAAVTNKNG